MNLLDVVIPGWEQADVLSNLEMILLMVVGPALVAGLILLLVMGPQMVRQRRGDAVATTEIEPRHN